MFDRDNGKIADMSREEILIHKLMLSSAYGKFAQPCERTWIYKLLYFVLPALWLLAAVAIANAQPFQQGIRVFGSITFGNCVKYGPGANQIQDTGGTCAAAAPVQSVFGRTGAVVAANLDYNFNQLAGNIGCNQQSAFSGDITTTLGSCVTSLTNSAVTYGKIQNVAASRLLGNPTGAPAAPSEISLGGSLAFSGTSLQRTALTGDVTASQDSNATTIAAAAVTYAKIQNVAASRLLGNPTGAGASVAEISLGATLAFSGTALQTAALTGDVTASANSFATTVVKMQGRAISASAPADTNVLAWNAGNNQWQPTAAGAGTVTNVNCAGTVITASGTCYSAGQIVGTNTNDNATAGNFGEVVDSSPSVSTALTSGTPVNCTSISLTGGNWLVFGAIGFNPNGLTVILDMTASISQTSATVTTNGLTTRTSQPGNESAVQNPNVSVGPTVIKVANGATPTIFLVARSNFTTNTMALLNCEITAYRFR